MDYLTLPICKIFLLSSLVPRSRTPALVVASSGTYHKVFAIGVTDLVNEETLKLISSPPHEYGETYFMADDFRALETIAASIAEGNPAPIVARALSKRIVLG